VGPLLSPGWPWMTVGLMSGTSLDGLDGVLLNHELRVLARAHRAMPAHWREEWLALNSPGPNELHRCTLAAQELSERAAHLVHDLLGQAGVNATQVQAIGFHGQTVRHQPSPASGRGYTLQAHQAALLAELTGIGVVCDFRSRDVAAGGQGAPLVPAFHAALWGRSGGALAVLNLGGISNVTVLQGDQVSGADCGPGNVLLDAWCLAHTGRPFDEDGAWGAQGRVDDTLLAHLQAEPFFHQAPPKSTGRDLFSRRWWDQQPVQGLAPVDVQATLAALTAWAVDQHLARWAPAVDRVWVCGGGVRNLSVMKALRDRLQQRHPGGTVQPTDEATPPLPAQDVEAAAFAWLAARFLQGLPGNCPPVTGAQGARVLGAWYPA